MEPLELSYATMEWSLRKIALENCLVVCRKTAYATQNPAIPLLGMYPKESSIHVYQKTFTRKIIGALLKMGPNWKRSIPSQPMGLAWPQGGRAPNWGWRVAWATGSSSCLWGPGHTEVAVEEEAARTLARSCVSWHSPFSPHSALGGGRKLCSSSNPLPVRASLQPQDLGWGR